MPGRKPTAAEKSFQAMNNHATTEEVFAQIFGEDHATPAATIPAADHAAPAPPAATAGGAPLATTPLAAAPAAGTPQASVVQAASPAARTRSASTAPAADPAARTRSTSTAPAAATAAGPPRARIAPAADLAAGAQSATPPVLPKPVQPDTRPTLESVVHVPPTSGMIHGVPPNMACPPPATPKSPKLNSQIVVPTKPNDTVTIDTSDDEGADPALPKPRRGRHPTPPCTRLAKPVSPAPPAAKKPRRSKCDQPAPAAKPGADALTKRADLARSVHAECESDTSESGSDLSAAGSDPLVREAASILDDSDYTDERSRTPSPEPVDEVTDDASSDDDGNRIEEDEDVNDEESDSDSEVELNPLQKKILSDAL